MCVWVLQYMQGLIDARRRSGLKFPEPELVIECVQARLQPAGTMPVTHQKLYRAYYLALGGVVTPSSTLPSLPPPPPPPAVVAPLSHLQSPPAEPSLPDVPTSPTASPAPEGPPSTPPPTASLASDTVQAEPDAPHPVSLVLPRSPPVASLSSLAPRTPSPVSGTASSQSTLAHVQRAIFDPGPLVSPATTNESSTVGAAVSRRAASASNVDHASDAPRSLSHSPCRLSELLGSPHPARCVSVWMRSTLALPVFTLVTTLADLFTVSDAQFCREMLEE